MFRSVSFSSRKKSTFVKNIQVKTFLKKCILVLDSNAVFGNKQLKIYNFTDFKAFFSKSIIFTAFTVFAAEWPPWKMSFKLEFFLLPFITLTPISKILHYFRSYQFCILHLLIFCQISTSYIISLKANHQIQSNCNLDISNLGHLQVTMFSSSFPKINPSRTVHFRKLQ